MKKQKRRKEKGITLMALVVTIIVLIILAGVTLNIVLDQNVIISKTQQAKEEWNEAEIAEKEAMLKAEAKILEFQNNTEHEMIEYYIDEVPIPKGFVYKEGTKETGLVIINKEDGNEFIWYPMSEEDAESITSTLEYSHMEISDEANLIASIKEYGGTYVARYQAGADVEITSLEQADETVYSQADKYPYIHVSPEKIVRLSKSMYPEEETNTTGAVSTWYRINVSNLYDQFGANSIPVELKNLNHEFLGMSQANLDGIEHVAHRVVYYDGERNIFINQGGYTQISIDELKEREIISFIDGSYDYATFRPVLYIKLVEDGTE